MGIHVLDEISLIPEFIGVSQPGMGWGDSSGLSWGAVSVPRVLTALFPRLNVPLFGSSLGFVYFLITHCSFPEERAAVPLCAVSHGEMPVVLTLCLSHCCCCWKGFSAFRLFLLPPVPEEEEEEEERQRERSCVIWQGLAELSGKSICQSLQQNVQEGAQSNEVFREKKLFGAGSKG